MRIGFASDIHRLVEGRKMILAGVVIPCPFGELAHSDGDVVYHAVAESILGALALGDLGSHFPDTDDKYKGISSLSLLNEVRDMLLNNLYIVENIDATIIAQKPKLARYIQEMRANIANTLKIDISQVSIKATTEEHLGFTGRGEGISAQAIVLIRRIK